MSTQSINESQAPCFLCGTILDIRLSKRQKPYLVCNWCGMQVFIRGKNGISYLNRWKNIPPNINQAGNQISEVTNFIQQLDYLKAHLKKAEENQGFLDAILSDDPAVLAIKCEIGKIEVRLRELAEKK